MVKLLEKKNMKKISKNISSLKWIFSVSRRFARVDRKGRSAVTSALATLGICFGVMTLIVVLSVMNGFQMSFIDAIMEISSYHVRISDVDSETEAKVYDYLKENNNILYDSTSTFLEAQTLMASEYGKESPAYIRAIDDSIYEKDLGFRKEITMVQGDFDLSQENSLVLGTSLARALRVDQGDVVNFLVLSGSNDVDLFSSERKFTVTGIFKSGYSEINSSFAFINLASAEKYMGKDADKIIGLKLKKSNNDSLVISQLENAFPQIKTESWRQYNKSFFGALRIEKNMLILLVAIIFVVVAINIYNGMRRLVFERKSEISILSALGAKKSEIKSVFIVRGFTIGLIGSFFGLLLGLLISINTDFVFNAASSLMFNIQYLFTAIFSPQTLPYIQENSSYALYANIPARIFFNEVVMISMFGILSPLFASYMASKNVLKLTIAEVLHHE